MIKAIQNGLVNFKNIEPFMLRTLFLLVYFFINAGICAAQDTIVLNGQPQWRADMDIADKSVFFEETSRKPLGFEEAQQQHFIPFAKEFRQQRMSARPLVIQWFRFIVRNTSASDTIDIKLFISAHYFTRLYANQQLVRLGGAYETTGSVSERFELPVKVLPLTTITFWARTEDRQNQLIPPRLVLKNPYYAAIEGAKGNYTDRYLFLMLAILTGCLMFICIYAIYQYYLYRDAAFRWYIAYAFAATVIGLYWLDIRVQLMLFPSFVRDFIFSVFLFTIPVLYSFFIGNMLQLPVHFKKGWMLVKVLIAINILQMLIEYVQVSTGWFPFNPEYYGVMLSIKPMILLHIVLLILTFLSKNPVKWFLFAGIISLIILWCLPLINILSYLPAGSPEFFTIVIFPPNFLVLGLTIEAVFFSFALSYRSMLVLIEKNSLEKNYRIQLQTALQQRTNELEEKNKLVEQQKLLQVQTAFEQKIAETEMTALRAQMNPHFIFNCLNSIQFYTLENDSKTASEYLTKFSQLIRLVLENSRSEKITLEKELETLKLYIDLEAMRFKDKVNYQINISPEVDQQFIDLPPLLIQPYVENAIWHGLMHKKEGGTILIDITQPMQDILQVEILDDGVGRERAAMYKSKSATRQKSFGLKMTSERIDMINHVYGIKADVKVIDLKDGMDNAIGTKVVIKIPV